MVAAAAGAFLLIRLYGESLTAPPADATQMAVGAATGAGHTLFHVLLALVVVILVSRLFGYLFGYLGQPPVIGEVVGGLALGPSLLGRVSPEAMDFVLPASVAPFLGVVAQLGVILYMFLVGIELDLAKVRRQARAAAAIATASTALPFVLGAALALWLYPSLSHGNVPFTSFALFVGVATAVTAFPVLARILTDRGLHTSDLGVLALSSAAAGDVGAWCLLALVVGVAQAQIGGALLVCAGAAAFIAAIIVVGRPLAAAIARRTEGGPLSSTAFAVVLAAVLLSALATEAIGVHAVFGAFLLGAVVPHDSRLARETARKLTDVVSALLLPAFFAYSGLRTHIGLVSGGEAWAMCAAIAAVATVSKFAAAFAAARLSGLGWRPAAAIGSLMNARGLMGLIVLNIGLELGVISPPLFAMMVVMALFTTLTTAPVLKWLVPNPPRAEQTALPTAPPIGYAHPPSSPLPPM